MDILDYFTDNVSSEDISQLSYGPPTISDGESLYRSGNTNSSISVTNILTTTTYKRRFWILAVFSLLSWFQCQQWVMWGPIAVSVSAAYPDWTSSTVAMMGNWSAFVFLIAVAPMCLLLQKGGLRICVIICALSLALGPLLRSISANTAAFTLTCHLSAILNGVAGTVVLSAPATVAAEWFPTHQRTSATAMIQASNALGAVGAYLEPLIVREPTSTVTAAQIRDDITNLMYIFSGISGCLLLCVVIYFPSKPPSPPSLSCIVERIHFSKAFITLLRNTDAVMLTLSFGLTVGVTAAWGEVLDYSLIDLGLDQEAAMWVGLWASVATGVLRLTAGRLTDLVYGYVKPSLLVIMLLSLSSYYWFFLISYGTIPPVKWQIYTSVIAGVSLTFSVAPLFFELAVENAYPCPEIVVGGLASFLNNLVGVIFLCFFFIPNIGFTWVTYCLLGFGSIAVIPLVCAKERYRRSQADQFLNT